MKSKEEIEHLAEEYVLQPNYDDKGHKGSFIKGYTQCQEDTSNYLRDILLGFCRTNFTKTWLNNKMPQELVDNYLQSLNKKD